MLQGRDNIASSLSSWLSGERAFGPGLRIMTVCLSDFEDDERGYGINITEWASLLPTDLLSPHNLPEILSSDATASFSIQTEEDWSDEWLSKLPCTDAREHVQTLIINLPASITYGGVPHHSWHESIAHMVNVSTIWITTGLCTNYVLSDLAPSTPKHGYDMLFPSLKTLRISLLKVNEGTQLDPIPSEAFKLLRNTLRARADLGSRLDMLIMTQCNNVRPDDVDALKACAVQVIWKKTAEGWKK